MPMDKVLEGIYNTAPRDFRDVFQAKRQLYNSLTDLKKINPQNIEEYLTWLGLIRQNLSCYHSSSFALCSPLFAETLQEIFSLSEIMEEAFIKGLILAEHKKLAQDQIERLRTFDKIFDEEIWCPLAYGISESTVVGLRSEEVRKQQKSKRIDFLKRSSSLIQNLKTSLFEHNLRMSWSDSIEWYKQTRHEDIEKKLADIQRIYERSPQREHS
jgi:hypothetical protein